MREKHRDIRAFCEALERHKIRGTGRGREGGWTLRELADEIDRKLPERRRKGKQVHVEGATVSRWIRGKNVPSDAQFTALCRCFWPSVSDRKAPDHRVALNEFSNLRTHALLARNRLRLQAGRTPPSSVWQALVQRSIGNTLFLATEPDELAVDDVHLLISGASFVIAPPPSFREALSSDPVIDYACAARACSFDGSEDFGDVERLTGISNLRGLIERHSTREAEAVLGQLKDPRIAFKPYNKPKFGVRRLEYFVPHDAGRERQAVRLYLFATDYFTHRVMRRLYQELKQEDHAITQIGRETPRFQDRDYCCFFTSLGVNLNVVIAAGDNPQLVLTQTARMGSQNQSFRWHVAANEGLNHDDAEASGISTGRFIRRALKEELGLVEELDSEAAEMRILGVFMDRRNLEIGIHGRVSLPLTFEELSMVRELRARDNARESRAIRAIPFSESGIASFAEELARDPLEQDFVSYAPALLQELILRELR